MPLGPEAECISRDMKLKIIAKVQRLGVIYEKFESLIFQKAKNG